MRKEPYTVGSYVHVVKRGQRKQPITKDIQDQWRFLKILRHFNDQFSSPNWYGDLNPKEPFKRISQWSPQRPLVEILAFCLMPNHFHLLLREIREGGISKFMQKIGTGMSNYYNMKYEEVGSLFQGAFKSRTINEDIYLRYVAVYIMVKNPLELYPGGLSKAIEDFDSAYDWAVNYEFASLKDFIGKRHYSIISPGILKNLFKDEAEFKAFAKDCLEGRNMDFNEVRLR